MYHLYYVMITLFSWQHLVPFTRRSEE